MEHIKYYSCVFERLHFKWCSWLVMANAENPHSHKHLYKRTVKHSQPNSREWGFPFSLCCWAHSMIPLFSKICSRASRHFWSWRIQMFEMLTVKMLTLFIANLAYATNSSFNCGNSDTHFLSLAKVSILIPNIYTTQSRNKLQMIMVLGVARLPEQNTGFIQWILKMKISHLNFLLQLFWYQYCW